MKISIVTISFNQASFLEQSILSVLNQDYADVEYIVVDPGSTDGSREIIERYHNRIDHIIFEPDNGPADGLNKGFSFASGDIFGYLNSDDILCEDSLKYVIDYFKLYKNVDVLNGAAKLINEDDKVYRLLYSDSFNKMAAAYCACILIQPSSFFTKSIYLKTNGFNAKNTTNWDSELFLDMAVKGAKFKAVNHVLSCYRIHDKSITGTMATLNNLQKHNEIAYTKMTGNEFTSYSKHAAKYYKYKRKIMNLRDTFQRIKGGKVYGRALMD